MEELQKILADKAYVESIAKMSAEDAVRSFCEKGVEVTAGELIKVRDFVEAHRAEMENGELTEKALAEVSGGAAADMYLMGLLCLAICTAPLW